MGLITAHSRLRGNTLGPWLFSDNCYAIRKHEGDGTIIILEYFIRQKVLLHLHISDDIYTFFFFNPISPNFCHLSIPTH